MGRKLYLRFRRCHTATHGHGQRGRRSPLARGRPSAVGFLPGKRRSGDATVDRSGPDDRSAVLTAGGKIVFSIQGDDQRSRGRLHGKIISLPRKKKYFFFKFRYRETTSVQGGGCPVKVFHYRGNSDSL